MGNPGHEARTSLLSGQSSVVLERPYMSDSPYDNAYDQSYQPYAGGYHQREGLTPAVPYASEKKSWLYVPNSKWTWAFFLIVVFQALVCLALEGYIFGQFGADVHYSHTTLPDGSDSNRFSRPIPTYLSLFIFGFIFQIVLTYDALRLKNTIQVIGLCIFNVCLLVEAGVQIDQIHDAINESATSDQGAAAINPHFWQSVKAYVIALPIILAVGSIPLCYAAWKLYDEFAWSIYKNISADLRLKRRYLSYQIYIALLKFDFFFFLAFTIQFLVAVLNTALYETILTAAAIPVTIISLFLSAYWTRIESVPGMIVSMCVYVAGLAYFLFKLIRMYFAPPIRIQYYIPVRHSLTTFAALTLVLILFTFVYCVICTVNFDKGLKPHIASGRRKRRAASQDLNKMYSHDVPLTGAAANPGRMTID